MDKKIAALLGAAAAVATVGGANATPAPDNEPAAATTYRDLLNPVVKPLEALKADDARLANKPAEDVKVAQIGIVIGHHHHHHHHHQVVPRVYVVPPRGYDHHHHHHHHHHHSSYYGR
jgi:hypothetical protein